ncbi:MAG: DUF4303 domain-containing protein [Planctomycetes bacterium]|nr:DUF4303 domain-containing protein [Planctomycetota bacterium]
MNDGFTNWALLYRMAGEHPAEFCEIRFVDSAVWVRSGNVKTWGKREVTECDSVRDATARFQAIREQKLVEGYVLTREGHYDPAQFDYEQLRNEIREGARKAFTAIKSAHPHHQINAFALVSDGDAMTIAHCANSVESHRETGGGNDYLWNAFEWPFDEGGGFLDIAYRLILTQCQGLPSTINTGDFRSGVFEACVRALEDLEREGCFGSEAEREKVVLLFQVADSDYLQHAIERLNTPRMYERFQAWWQSWN